jgi:isoquinoline 1-oxidoreductase beta subunit
VLNLIHHRPQAFDPYLPRRGVVIGRAAIGSGLMLSLALPFGSGKDFGTRSLAPNALIRVDSGGHVFLNLPYLETGQDSYASIPRLVAEELEVAMERVHVEHASPEGIHFNRMVIMQAATGSAEAIRNVWKPLCEAAATARDILIAAAAKRWDVDVWSCHAHEGEVIHTTTWRKLRYGELAAEAAHILIPRNVVLKQHVEAGLNQILQTRLE